MAIWRIKMPAAGFSPETGIVLVVQTALRLLGIMLAGKYVDRQTDKGHGYAAQGEQGGLGAAEEQLTYHNIQTADDGQYGDNGVKGNLVLAVKVRLLAAQSHYAREGQSVEYPAGEYRQVGQHIKLLSDGIQAAKEADQYDGVGGNGVLVQLGKSAAEGDGLSFTKVVGNAGAGKQEAVCRTYNGNYDTNLYQRTADRPEYPHGNFGRGGLIVHQFIGGDDPQISHIDYEVNGHYDGHAANDSAGKVTAGVLHFAGDSANVGPAFKCEQNRYKRLAQYCAGAQLRAGGGIVTDHGGEYGVSAFAEYEAEYHQQYQRDKLADGGNYLHAGSGLIAKGVDGNKNDYNGHAYGQRVLGTDIFGQLLTNTHAVTGKEGRVEYDYLHPTGKEADLIVVNFAKIGDHAAGLGD